MLFECSLYQQKVLSSPSLTDSLMAFLAWGKQSGILVTGKKLGASPLSWPNDRKDLQLNSKGNLSHWLAPFKGVNLFTRSLYSSNQCDSGRWPIRTDESVHPNQGLQRQGGHFYPVESAHNIYWGVFFILVLSELSFWERRSRALLGLDFKELELVLRVEEVSAKEII